jgi:hypothetical protein
VFAVRYEPNSYISFRRNPVFITLFLGKNKYKNLALEVVRVTKIEAIKYAHKSRRTQI